MSDVGESIGVMSLDTWEDVDFLIERMGRLDMEISSIELDAASELYGIIARYKERVGRIKSERAAIEEIVRDYCEKRKAEFAKKRSRQLNFGRIAFRVAEKLRIPKGKESVVVATLRALGLSECIHVKETVDLNAMKKLDDADLARCGVTREKSDHFRIEPNLDAIAKGIGIQVRHPGDGPAVDMDKVVGAIK